MISMLAYSITMSAIFNICQGFYFSGAGLGLNTPHRSSMSRPQIFQMCVERAVNEELIELANTGGARSDSDPLWQTPSSTIIPIDAPKFEGKPAVITFDAYETLIEPSQSIGRWYREALNAICDMQIRLPRPSLFTASFTKAFADM